VSTIGVNYNSRPTVHAGREFCVCVHYNIKKIKISKKTISKKIMILSYIFLPIMHNIGLYIYTVQYKSGIKYSVFFKIFQKIKNKKIKNKK